MTWVGQNTKKKIKIEEESIVGAESECYKQEVLALEDMKSADTIQQLGESVKCATQQMFDDGEEIIKPTFIRKIASCL